MSVYIAGIQLQFCDDLEMENIEQEIVVSAVHLMADGLDIRQLEMQNFVWKLA